MGTYSGDLDSYLEKLVAEQPHPIPAMFEKQLVAFVNYEDGTWGLGFDNTLSREQCRKISRLIARWIKRNPHMEVIIPDAQLQ